MSEATKRAVAAGVIFVACAWTPVRDAFETGTLEPVDRATDGVLRNSAERIERGTHRIERSVQQVFGDREPAGEPARGPFRPPADPEAARRQVAAAIALAEPLQDSAAEFAREHARLPNPELVGSAPDFAPRESSDARVSLGVGGMLEIRLTSGPLRGEEFSLIPMKAGGALQWECAPGRLPAEYFAGACPERPWRPTPP